MQRLFLPAAAGGLIALLAGCGGGEPFAYVPVSGKVTYDDGSKIPRNIELRFLPRRRSRWMRRPIPAAAWPSSTARRGSSSRRPAIRRATGWRRASIKWPWRPRTSVRSLPRPRSPEYTDFEKTPLVVDTADKETFNLKIRKPTTK